MKRVLVFFTISYLVAILLGVIGIMQSRSSTAAIGFVFLPFVSLVPGLLGAFWQYFQLNKYKEKNFFKILSSFCAILLALFFCLQLYQIFSIRYEYQARDIKAQQSNQKYRSARELITRLLHSNRQDVKEVFYILLQNDTSREMLIAVLETPLCPSELLEKYSHSDDMGVIQSITLNPKTPAFILEKIYKEAKYPSYYYSSLAHNPNTPISILRELYNKRDENTLIVPGLKDNPSTPDEIKRALTSSHIKPK